jgi:hypothetical protein
MATDVVRRLVYEGLLTEAEASAVVARRAMYGEPAPVALVATGSAAAGTLSALFERLGYMPASRLRPSNHARLLPKGLQRTLWVVPIGESPEGVVVAMVDPTDAHALRELRFHLRRAIDPRVAEMDALRAVVFEIDPPAEGKVNTRPAPGGAPPAQGDDAQWSAGSVEVFQREVVGLVRPRERAVTPPYGQPVVQGPNSSWGRGRSDVVKMEDASITLGATRARTMVSSTPSRGVDKAIPIRRRSSKSRAAVELPREALHPLGELKVAEDRDAIARVCVKALSLVGERAVFFVVKKGVVQGWDGACANASLAGLSKEALQNLWIPITSRSVFRTCVEGSGRFEGALTDSSADSIIAAALGGRPSRVVVAAIEVRGRVVAFLYVDNADDVDAARARVGELCAAAADAFERLLLSTRGDR